MPALVRAEITSAPTSPPPGPDPPGLALLGEGGVLGLCRPNVWPAALRSNFGDHLEPKNFDPAELEAALRALLRPRQDPQELSRWAHSQIEKDFDIRTIASQVEAIYQKALRR